MFGNASVPSPATTTGARCHRDARRTERLRAVGERKRRRQQGGERHNRPDQQSSHWEGHHSSPFAAAGSDTIRINGEPVVGTLIGGPTAFFGQFQWSSAQTETFSTYRADITARNLVLAGTNTVSVTDMLFQSNFGSTAGAFNAGNGGVGVLVIYDGGGTAANIAGRDGSDLA